MQWPRQEPLGQRCPNGQVILVFHCMPWANLTINSLYSFTPNQTKAPKQKNPCYKELKRVHEHTKPALKLLWKPEPRSWACVHDPTASPLQHDTVSLLQLTGSEVEGPYPIKNNRKLTTAINPKLWLLQLLIFHEQLLVCKTHATFSFQSKTKQPIKNHSKTGASTR